MRNVTLPAKNEDGTQNFISIKNSKLQIPGETEAGYQFKVPAESFTYQQYDALDEFIQDCGGEDKALKVVNAFKEKDALKAGNNKIRTTVTGTPDEIVKAGIEATKSHSFNVVETITAAEAKSGLNQIAAKLGELSDAEIAAEVRKLLGQA